MYLRGVGRIVAVHECTGAARDPARPLLMPGAAISWGVMVAGGLALLILSGLAIIRIGSPDSFAGGLATVILVLSVIGLVALLTGGPNYRPPPPKSGDPCTRGAEAPEGFFCAGPAK